MQRREFLLGLAGAAMCPAMAQSFKLIAHRGGVVGADHPENSAAAIAGAIEHGYWMVEVDVRRTKDGEPIIITMGPWTASMAIRGIRRN